MVVKTIPVIHLLFFLPDTLSILRKQLLFIMKHVQTQTHGCMNVFKEVCVQTNTHVHLLMLCINTPTFVISYFCRTLFNRNSHMDSKLM